MVIGFRSKPVDFIGGRNVNSETTGKILARWLKMRTLYSYVCASVGDVARVVRCAEINGRRGPLKLREEIGHPL